MLDLFDLGFASEISEEFPPNDFVDLSESYYKDAAEFFANFDGFDGMEILGVEENFKIEIEHPDENYQMRGFVDLIYKTPNGIVVRDWKSKSKFKNKAEQYRYARQLYLYAEYIKRQYGEYPCQMEFYMFRKNTIVDVPFKEKELREAIDWSNNLVSKIRVEKDFEPVQDEWFCSWLCDQRETCSFKGVE